MEQIDMTKLENALIFVNRIADGKNPINDAPSEDDSVLNDPNVIRCMFFIKEVLTSVKNNNGSIGRRQKSAKKPFPMETLSSFVYAEDKTITRFVAQLNDAIDTNEYKKVAYKDITDWLKENDYLQDTEDEILKKKVTLATEKGNSIGISHSLKTSMSGISYYRVSYNQQAQDFLVENLPKIIPESLSFEVSSGSDSI